MKLFDRYIRQRIGQQVRVVEPAPQQLAVDAESRGGRYFGIVRQGETKSALGPQLAEFRKSIGYWRGQ